MTQTGRLRLEHRHGWLDAVMLDAVMARCCDGWRTQQK